MLLSGRLPAIPEIAARGRLRYRNRQGEHGAVAAQSPHRNCGTPLHATATCAGTRTADASGEEEQSALLRYEGPYWRVDAKSGITHTLGTTAANTADIMQVHALLHEEERVAFGDAGYQGVEVSCRTKK